LKGREVKNVELSLVTADRGLCGAYNANLLRGAEDGLRAAAPAGSRPVVTSLVLVGKKGRDYFRRRRYPVLAAHTPLPTEASLEFARTLTQDLIARFLSGEVDRVEIMFTRFISALNRKVIVDPFLPVGAGAAGPAPTSAIFEPDAASDMAENVGKVVQVIGPTVDVAFDADKLPRILNAIRIEDPSRGIRLTVEAALHIGDNIVRCVAMASTDGLVRGMPAVDSGEPISVPVGEGCLGRIFNLLGDPIDGKGQVAAEKRYPIHRRAPTFEVQEPLIQ